MSGEGDDSIPTFQVSDGNETAVKSANDAAAAFDDYYKHSHTTSETRVKDILAHVGQGGVKKRASLFMGSPQIKSPITPIKSPSPIPGAEVRQSAFAKNLSNAQMGEFCERCKKRVYAAEKISTTNGLYHKSCLSCGLDHGTGCQRPLDATNYGIYAGVVYCKTCSKKQHEADKQIKAYQNGTSPAERRASLNAKGRGASIDGGADSSFAHAAAEAAAGAGAAAHSPKPMSLSSVFGSVSLEESLNESEDVEPAQKVDAPLKTDEAVTTAESESVHAVAEAEAEHDEAAKEEEEDDEDEDGEGEDSFPAAPKVQESPGRRSSIDPLPGTRSFHECPFTFPFDKNGAIWWVGSMGGQQVFENPQKTGGLYLEISTLYRGQLLNLTSYHNAETAADRISYATYTNNTSRSWLVVDFGPERQLRPSYYCLKHGASGIGNAIRHWVLEAKVSEDSEWVELRRHTNDTTMREEPQSVAGYELSGEVCRSKFYRIFRITQTGKNSGGNDCLFIGGIDFYGIMKVEKV